VQWDSFSFQCFLILNVCLHCSNAVVPGTEQTLHLMITLLTGVYNPPTCRATLYLSNVLLNCGATVVSTVNSSG
jgi:hypothetical protein